MIYPRAFSHVGLSVPDIDKAVKFYTSVMGFYLVTPPTEVFEDKTTPSGIMAIGVFGEGWGSFKICHMSTSDGVGIELFQFGNNQNPVNNFEYYKTGVFHFGVLDPDIEGLVAKIVEYGGKQRMPICEFYPGKQPYKMCYVEDPYGIIFEVYSHAYETTFLGGAYD